MTSNVKKFGVNELSIIDLFSDCNYFFGVLAFLALSKPHATKNPF
jgi:hypothetical protein